MGSGGWQRQAAILLLAVVGAMWHMWRAQQMWEEKHNVEAQQLNQAVKVVTGNIRDVVVYNAQPWQTRQPKGGYLGASSPSSQASVLILRPAEGQSLPLLLGEILSDPIRRKESMSNKKPTRPGGRKSPNKNLNRSAPLLIFRLYDPTLANVAEQLVKLGLVARVQRLGPARTSAKDSMAELSDRNSQGNVLASNAFDSPGDCKADLTESSSTSS
mmetsp:Transcript_22109/g.41459  ORF Transcript_22109/g.41459 Transcript_22109/m.41459 type:complete len:215 (+) Transcript_22109:516-1160(+)